jgi:hypothetical protein
MFGRAVLLVLLLSITIPSVGATEPTCTQATAMAASPTGLYAQRVGGNTAVYDVWRESNGVDGLQKVACRAEDGSLAPPDEYLGEFGASTGGQPVCVTRVGCVR